MGFKAVFLDFYGTLVHEDDVFIKEICEKILLSSAAPATLEEISKYWWETFSSLFQSSYGDTFQTQRQLELTALEETLTRFQSSEDASRLCEELFNYWQAPDIFPETKAFLAQLQLPIIIVSNIDRNDIEAAIAKHGFIFQHMITSEDVRSYKPRPHIFQQALEQFKLNANEVLHVGDSLLSDVGGAQQLGIKVAWINRKGKSLPPSCSPDHVVTSLTELLQILA